MAKSKVSKEQTLAQLQGNMSRMKSLVFTHYQGLSVKDVTDLRKTLRAESVDLIVAKKTLLRKALAASGFEAAVVDQLPGDVALAFGYADEVMPAKLLQKYGKDHPAVALVGALVNGQHLTAEQAIALAKLPGREELIAKTVWVIKAPLTGLVNVMAGNLRGLLTVLNAIKDRQPTAA